MSDDSGAWADRQRLNLQGWLRGARADLGLTDEPPADELVAVTAGEEDHSDPWRFAGVDAAPPGAP